MHRGISRIIKAKIPRDPKVAEVLARLAVIGGRQRRIEIRALADIPAVRLERADEFHRLRHGCKPLPPATRLPVMGKMPSVE